MTSARSPFQWVHGEPLSPVVRFRLLKHSNAWVCAGTTRAPLRADRARCGDWYGTGTELTWKSVGRPSALPALAWLRVPHYQQPHHPQSKAELPSGKPPRSLSKCSLLSLILPEPLALISVLPPSHGLPQLLPSSLCLPCTHSQDPSTQPWHSPWKLLPQGRMVLMT